MGGITSDKRQIIFCSNMFDPTQKEISEFDRSLSFKEIYEGLTVYPPEYSVIIDGDVKIDVEDYNDIPKSDTVYIKLFPSGGGVNNFFENGPAQIGVGLMFITVGAAITIASGGTLSWAGIGLISVGAGMVLTGTSVAFRKDEGIGAIKTSTRATTEENSSLRGGANQKRDGGRIPVLLGKHLINPDLAALSYISASGSLGKDQFLHMMFCPGYNNIDIDTSSYKIGNTPLISGNFDGYILNVSQDGSSLSSYPSRVIATSVSALIESTNANGIVKTTPTNTKKIEVIITFPQGLTLFKDGVKNTATVQFLIQYAPSPVTNENQWRILASVSPEAAEAETIRFIYTKDLLNETSSGSDYCASRQYDVRVKRITAEDKTNTNLIDKAYFDTMQCTTGVFNGSTVDTAPVIGNILINSVSTPIKNILTLMALKIKSTDTVNGQIEAFNFIGQSKVKTYSGTGTGVLQWATIEASSNPAAMFLFVAQNPLINKKPATDNQINWASLETWYTFCASKGLECNSLITSETVLEEILTQIAIAGRASWNIVDGKYNIVVDKSQPTRIQYFTPRNSWGFTGEKVFADMPTGLRAKFVDKDAGYIEAERIVFVDEDDPDYGKIDDVTLFGCTSASEAWVRAKYILACIYLRPEVFTFSADIEHIICTRWDHIAFGHDVCEIGLGFGRIKTFRTSGGNVTGFEIDERVIFEPSKSYVVTVRLQNGTGITYAIANPASTVNVDTDEIILDSAIPIGDEPFNVDDLLVFGESSNEVIDLIVTDIEPSDDFSAKITCIPYIEALYSWDGGTIPAYDSKISIPGDLDSAVYLGVPVSAAEMAIANSQLTGEINNIETALTAIYDTLIEVGDGTYYPAFPYFDYSLNLLLYTNLTDEGIWQTAANSVDKGTELNAIAGYVSCNNMYVKSADGCIYDMSNNQKTYSESWCPQVNEAGDIIYVKLSDGGMYKKAYVSGAITQIGSFTLKHFEIYYYGNQKVLIWDDGTISGSGTGAFILVDIDTGLYYSTIAAYLSEPVSFSMLDYDTLLYLDTDFNLHRVELADSNEDYLYIPDVLQFSCFNNIIYYITPAGKMYKRFKDMAAAKIDSRPYIKTSLTYITITGDGVSGENIISGISATDIGVIFIDDILSGTGIPENAKVLTIDTANSRILIDKKLTSSFTDQVIAVVTSRLQIDARTAIAEGTVTETELGSGAVTFYKMATDAVGTAHIVNLNVTAAKLAADAVETAKIKNAAVTNDKLASDAVRTSHIYDGAVTTAKITDANVTAGKLASDAVETAKIKDANVTAAKLASDAVETAKIKDANVTTAKIADLNVTTGKIDAKAITVAKLDDSAVEEIKIASNAVTASKIKDGEVTSAKLASSIDMTSKSLILPNSASIAPTTEGSIGWDSDDNILKVGDGSATKIMVDTTSTQTVSNKTIDSTCKAVPKAKFNGIFMSQSVQTFTENDLFDTLSPFIPNNNDTMILSGAIYNISTLYIASYALRYDSTTIVIGTFTGGSVVSFNIRDGNSTNLPNMLISY